MTDPIRRDPAYFLRTLKKMAHTTSWQKAMIFASKGRMVGYQLQIEHYNTILFSQSMWGRALEITRVINAMKEDGVQPNGASYYYICNGMANVDHGYNYDFALNHRLPYLQHWRIAINALEACEANGFDATDTMYNSCICACTIPGTNQWQHATALLNRLRDQERKPHPTMVKFFHDCLVRNYRPQEAARLLTYAAEQQTEGYEETFEPDTFEAREAGARQLAVQCVKTLQGEIVTLSADGKRTSNEVNLERQPEYREELVAASMHPQSGGVPAHATEPFRPRVYRYSWYKWHAIANKYRPHDTLKKKQLTPRDSPCGLPGLYLL